VIEIGIAPAAAAADPALVEELAALVNRAYAVAEDGLWIERTPRTTQKEMADLIAAEQVALAYSDGKVIGAVRVRRLDSGEAEFGMLVADFSHRGQGVGRDLVGFAERWSRDQGIETMQLEILMPRDWSHPSKEFLKAWYGRMGYHPVRTCHLEQSYPDLAPLLATPCDFVIYHKDLGRSPQPPS
jgi:GNAT superfamily N-acetyltransferase